MFNNGHLAGAFAHRRITHGTWMLKTPRSSVYPMHVHQRLCRTGTVGALMLGEANEAPTMRVINLEVRNVMRNPSQRCWLCLDPRAP